MAEPKNAISPVVEEQRPTPISPDYTIGADEIAAVITGGDLSGLTPAQKVNYYMTTCSSLGLNPYTKPFEYLALKDDNGGTKVVMYATRNCTDQLRDTRKVNIVRIERETTEGVYVVTAYAEMSDGRTDSSIGAVPLVKEDGEWKTAQGSGKRYFAGTGEFKPIGPDARANAMMKAETKAKRRVTLSICGLSMIDESEIETIRGASVISVDRAHSDDDLVGRNQPAAIEAPRTVKPAPVEDTNTIPAESLELVRNRAAERGIEGYDFDWLAWHKFGVNQPAALTVTQGRVLYALVHATPDDALAALMDEVKAKANDHANQQAAAEERGK
jgi:hypothetical protein